MGLTTLHQGSRRYSTFVRALQKQAGGAVLICEADTAVRAETARKLAAELGRSLHRVDLSQLATKYIGETEKNLVRLVDVADEKNVILYFDEADALFGKRTQVKDSQDRYANVEASYFLQWIERFSGVTLVAACPDATTLRKHQDDFRAVIKPPRRKPFKPTVDVQSRPQQVNEDATAGARR